MKNKFVVIGISLILVIGTGFLFQTIKEHQDMNGTDTDGFTSLDTDMMDMDSNPNDVNKNVNDAKLKTPITTTNQNSATLKIPVLEQKQTGNPLAGVNIVGYSNQNITTGSEFTIDPETYDPMLKDQVAGLKLTLLAIQDDSITINIRADVLSDGSSRARSSISTATLVTGSCVAMLPLVMDVTYNACFTVGKEGQDTSIKYKIMSDSSMAVPY